MLRKHVRQKQNLKTEMILKEFQDLGRLDELHRDPVRSRSQARDTDPSPESFAKFLEDIFHSNAGFGTEYLQSLLNSVKHKCRFDIPKFTMLELQRVMRQLKNRKCADADGLVAEMFKRKFGSDEFFVGTIQQHARYRTLRANVAAHYFHNVAKKW